MKFHRERRSRPLVEAVQKQQPLFMEAVRGDLEAALKRRGEPTDVSSNRAAIREMVRLSLATDAFAALVFYRGKAATQRRGHTLTPRLLSRLAMSFSQISIGDPVRIEPGVIVPHGQLVIDGFTSIGAGTRLRPFVTIGLREGDIAGPTIGQNVSVGTGAKILGAVTVGDNASIGANAVVLDDVAPGMTVVGVPARPLPPR